MTKNNLDFCFELNNGEIRLNEVKEGYRCVRFKFLLGVEALGRLNSFSGSNHPRV